MSRGSFLAVKRPRREVNHQPPSSAKFKNEWSYTSNPHICLHDVGKKKRLRLPYCRVNFYIYVMLIVWTEGRAEDFELHVECDTLTNPRNSEVTIVAWDKIWSQVQKVIRRCLISGFRVLISEQPAHVAVRGTVVSFAAAWAVWFVRWEAITFLRRNVAMQMHGNKGKNLLHRNVPSGGSRHYPILKL